MPTIYEIPLSPAPQSFNIALPISYTSPVISGSYRMVFSYRNAPMAGWVLDIYDANGDPMLCGVPLVTGCDLLEQYAYLNFGAKMIVSSDGNPEALPAFDNLGIGSHVWWMTFP